MNKHINKQGLILPIMAMGIVILCSNILVAYPLPFNFMGIDLSYWLTFGAFTYPFAFLVTDLTNRFKGITAAKLIVVPGFVLGIILSLIFADIRIAIASALAFGLSQFLDIHLFHLLRTQSWWKAPLFSSIFASILDTALFFSIAFYGTDVPWIGLAIGDLMVKMLMALILLPLFYGLMRLLPTLSVKPS